MRILRLIKQLPRTSRFSAAVAANPEHVKEILKATGGQRDSYSPPLTEWTVENEQLATLLDLTEKLIGVQIASNGGKPGKIKPSPRPQTAFDEARTNLAKEEHKRMVSKVLRKAQTVD